MTTMYGIPNCDTIKKAKKWLTENNIPFDFHDYKKQGVDESVLSQTIDKHGLEKVLNKRGTTFRKLPGDVKNQLNDESSVLLMLENPSMIKRPIVEHNGQIIVGFTPASYEEFF